MSSRGNTITNDIALSTTAVKLFTTPNTARTGYRFYNNTAVNIYLQEVGPGQSVPTFATMVTAGRITVPPITPGSFYQSDAGSDLVPYVVIAAGTATLLEAEEIV